MNVDTGDLTELVRQVAALTGRVSKLSTEVRRTRERVEQSTSVAQVLRNAGGHEAEYRQMLARARKGRHARSRPAHLRVVR